MTSPQLRYFKDVLGVHTIVVPEDMRDQIHQETFGNESSLYMALISEDLTDDYEELIQKMFASIGQTDFCIVNFSELSKDQLSNFVQGKEVIWVYGKPINVDCDCQLFLLPSLSDLQHSRDAKREAWNKIKVLK